MKENKLIRKARRVLNGLEERIDKSSGLYFSGIGDGGVVTIEANCSMALASHALGEKDAAEKLLAHIIKRKRPRYGSLYADYRKCIESNGLFDFYVDTVDTEINSLYAIASYLLEHFPATEKIVLGINKKIGMNDELLYKDSVLLHEGSTKVFEYGPPSLKANILMALTLNFLGHKKEARRLFRDTKKRYHRKNDMLVDSEAAYPNGLMALAYHFILKDSSKAEKIVRTIDEKIGYKVIGNYLFYDKYLRGDTKENAVMAFLFATLGNKNLQI